MERIQTIWRRGRPKKTIREVINKDFEINDLIEAHSLIEYYDKS